MFCVDLDTVIVNETISLESIIYKSQETSDADVIMTMDFSGPNTGVFLVRQSEWTQRFLKKWFGIKQFDTPPWYTSYPFLYEQRGLHYLLCTDIWERKGLPVYEDCEKFRLHFAFVPQCTMNSYLIPPDTNRGTQLENGFHKTDFIVHFAGFKDGVKRGLMDFYLKRALPEREKD